MDDFESRFNRTNTQGESKMTIDSNVKRIIKWVSWGIGAIILIIILFNSNTRISPGYAGVKYSLFTGLQEDVEKEGLVWHAPWVNIYEYPISTETVNLKKTKKSNQSIQVNTGDGKSVEMDITYAFSMKQDKLPHIFKRFRRQSAEVIADQYIKQEILNTTQNITTKNSVLQVYSQKREEIADQARKILKDSLAEDGIILEKFTFADVRPDKDTKKILQQVADAENQREVLIRQEKNLEQEKNNIAQQKENEKLAAKEDKEIAKINAEKQAEKTLIEAKAQAEANRELAKSVTSTLVNYELAKKWDGKQSLVSGGNSLIQMPDSFLEDTKKEDKK